MTERSTLEASDNRRMKFEVGMGQNKEVLHKANILVVDDDPETCQLLTLILNSYGYRPVVVSSGQEALKRVSANYPDLIVLDIMMPGMDGWETYEQLRMISNVPILFLTALASGDDVCRACRLGAADYMCKPFQPDDLLTKLGVLLNNRHRPFYPRGNHEGTAAVKNIEPSVSVVIPAYNEAAGLPLVLESLWRVLDHHYEVLVVDDGSSDDTAHIAMAYPCRLIRHPHNLGKGAALRTGLQHARGQKVIFIDADNTYPVEAISSLVGLLDEYDLARGVRAFGRSHIPRLNRAGNFFFDSLIRLLHAVDGSDVLSGIYGGRRECLLALDLEATGFDIEAEICVKAKARGLRYGTLPIVYGTRLGQTKLKAFHDGIRILSRLLGLAVAYSPLIIFILPGLFLLVVGLAGVGLMQIQSLRLLLQELSAHGTFILGMIGLFGSQLTIFGLAIYTAGKYLGWLGCANRVLDKACQILANRTTMLAGIALGTIGCTASAKLILDWFWQGHGDFQKTEMLVAMSVGMLLGIQLFTSSVFFSALRRLSKSIPEGIQKKLDKILSRLPAA